MLSVGEIKCPLLLVLIFLTIDLSNICASCLSEFLEDHFAMNNKTVSKGTNEDTENKISFSKYVIGVCILVIGVFATIQVSNIFMDSKYVGEEKIKENVVFHANTDYESIEEYRCEIDIDEDGVVVYKAFCSTPKGVYDFTFDAKSGDLIAYNYAEYGQQITEDNIS